MSRRILNGLGVWWLSLVCVAGQAVPVDRGVAVADVWRADRPLYVKGGLGIAAEHLDALDAWLREKAPNWTVVLMRDARGETYRDAEGRTYQGMDAVEHALGQRLPAETGFGAMRHPETGELNGAYFILFLEERKLSYHASEVYDRRRLGEDHWIGNLDAPAIAAMRQGGRVIDAARNTISSIDAELARRLRMEVAEREREIERQRRTNEETAAAIRESRLRLEDLTARTAGLRRDFNQPPGDLANPPLARWGAKLDSAERLLGTDAAAAASELRQVADWIDAQGRRLHDHERVPGRIREIEGRMDGLSLHEASVAARQALMEARAQLAAAGDAHARADSAAAMQVSTAEALIVDATRLDQATRGAARRLEELADRATRQGASQGIRQMLDQAHAALFETGRDGGMADEIAARLDREQAVRVYAMRQRAMRKSAVIAGIGVAVLGLLAAGWLGRRRRREPKRLALEAFATWEATLRQRGDGLFELLDRTSKAVGSGEALERSGRAGETLELSRGVLADVDHLFVLASGIDRVLDEARGLLFPKNPWFAAVNGVSRQRFDRALHLLEKQPLRFSPDDPVRTMIQGRPVGEWRDLLAQRGGESEFSLTFPELNDAFHQRATRAVDALGVLESCWGEVHAGLDRLEKELARIEALERETDRAAAADGRFEMAAVFDQLLPSARRDFETAEDRASMDPVAVLSSELALGTRKAADAAGLCERVLEFRANLLPALELAAANLTGEGRRTEWIGSALDDLSRRADELSLAALERGISADLEALAADGAALAARAERSAALARRALGSELPAIDEAARRVVAERERLATALGVPADRPLKESDESNPDRHLEEARRHHGAAVAELDRGADEAALHSLDACARWCATAQGVMDETARAFSEADAAWETIPLETSRVEALVPAAIETHRSLARRFSPEALRLRHAGSPHEAADAAVEDQLSEAEERLGRAREAITAARESHRTAALLKAAALRDEAVEANAEAAHHLALVHRHAEVVEATIAGNQTAFANLQQRSARLAAAVGEPVATRPTLRDFANATEQLESAAVGVPAEGPAADPFATAALLSAVATAFDAVEESLTADRSHHAETARSLAATERELLAGRQWVDQAQGDGIPDSPQTQQCIARIQSLETELEALRQRFSEPHGDWAAIDAEVDALAAEATRVNGSLRGELERAVECARAVQDAAERVRAASSWLASTGSGALEQARAVLATGDYVAALAQARLAWQQADEAIRQEEERERRRQREAAQRREAELRRQRSRSSSGFGSSRSSFSSGGRSSFSSGSGSRRSSFSSGSGTKRSGW
jgi:hypothetical protein